MNNRWYIALRRASYRLREDGSYEWQDEHRRLNSETYVVQCDDLLNITDWKLVEDHGARNRANIGRQGLEDARIFHSGTSLFGLWSALDGAELNLPGYVDEKVTFRPDWSRATNTMVLGQIDSSRVTRLHVIPSPHGRGREKNWMPAVDDGRIFFLYSPGELEVYSWHDGVLDFIHRRKKVLSELSDWSGSSQVIRWNEGWLCICHYAGRNIKTSFRQIGPFYFHKLLYMSRDWDIIATSKRFFFERRGLEFCAGLEINGDHVVVSYGVNDSSAVLMKISNLQIQGLLRPIRIERRLWRNKKSG